LPTNAGAKGCTLNAKTATIVTISMADASSTSSAMTAVTANKGNNKKSLPKQEDKGFKLCHLHGKQSNHSYVKGRANPCNQAREHQQQLENSNQKNTKPP
jgi:hypothetical protein